MGDADTSNKRRRRDWSQKDESQLARQMRQQIKFLADDLLKGRQPGTLGEELAATYVANQMELIGCEPAGENGTYFQGVEMVGMTVQRGTSQLAFQVGDFQVTGRFGEDYVHSMDHLPDATQTCAFEGLDVVFAGHGITAPALQWDDFKNFDVKGKVVLVLVNQPPVLPFPEEDMTYQGRWVYKFEEARRRGAAGCMIIHFSDDFAGYPWSVARTGYSGEKVALQGAITNPLSLHGWLHRGMAAKLAEATGTSLDSWVAEARDRSFAPRLVGRVSHAAAYNMRSFRGRNVLGLLRGESATHEHELVVIAGHHDHLGERDGEIYNGAVDNCTGVAMMLATATRLLEEKEPLARSVLFLAPTAEECGLLGSEFYAAKPLPISGKPAQPVAAFAFDIGNVWGRTEDLSVLGYGKSTLDPVLDEAAAKLNLRIVPDQQPRMGLYYRSDHWSFVRRGVPGCWFFFGRDFAGKPEGYYDDVVGTYIRSEYHKPADVYKPTWTMDGLIMQVDYTMAVTTAICNRTSYYPKLHSEGMAGAVRAPDMPDMPDVTFRRPPLAMRSSMARRASVSFGLRCFDCKIEGCVCFL